MILTIKHKLSIYKRFETDIWGYCFNMRRSILEDAHVKVYEDIYKIKNPLFKFFFKLHLERTKKRHETHENFVYRIKEPTFLKRDKKNFNLRFISIRLTRLYFLTFQDYQFRKLLRRAAKYDGNFEINYVRFLECRLLSIIYRLNYTSDIFWLLSFVRQKNNIFLDFKSISHPNTIIPIGGLITINPRWQLVWDWNLLNRLRDNSLLFNRPKYLFISYKCHFAYLMRYPRKKDLIYPFNLDIQRITGYY